MDDKTLFLLIFGGIFGGLGLIFLLIGIGISSSVRKKRQLCRSKAIGTVIDNVHKSCTDARYSYWHPVIQFTTSSGQSVTLTYPFGTGTPKYSKGQEISLMYDPQNPKSVLLLGDNTAKILTIVFSSIGAGMIFIAALVCTLVAFLWK